MKKVATFVYVACAACLLALTITLTVESESFRSVVKYRYDADKIPCRQFQVKLVTEFPATYPELTPLATEILARAKQRHYISLKDGRLMQDAVEQVQELYKAREAAADKVANRF